MGEGRKREKEPKYIYTISHSLNREHSNSAYHARQKVPAHPHDFVVELKLRCKDIRKCNTGDNNYQLDLSIVQNHLKEYLELLPDNLNDHEILGKTSCSVEDILDYVGIYFLKYLKQKGVGNIKIKKIEVMETKNTGVSLSGKRLRKKLKMVRNLFKINNLANILVKN